MVKNAVTRRNQPAVAGSTPGAEVFGERVLAMAIRTDRKESLPGQIGSFRQIDEAEPKIDQQKKGEEDEDVDRRRREEDGRTENHDRDAGGPPEDRQRLVAGLSRHELRHLVEVLPCRGEIAPPALRDGGAQVAVPFVEEITLDRWFRLSCRSHGFTLCDFTLLAKDSP